MEIKVWVVWWKGTDMNPASVCKGEDGKPTVYFTRAEARAERRRWRNSYIRNAHTVKPATLTISEPK